MRSAHADMHARSLETMRAASQMHKIYSMSHVTVDLIIDLLERRSKWVVQTEHCKCHGHDSQQSPWIPHEACHE